MSKPKCKLIGSNGNAFAIIGLVSQTLKRAGQREKVNEYQEKAMSGDYNNLIAVSLEYVDIDDSDNDSDNE